MLQVLVDLLIARLQSILARKSTKSISQTKKTLCWKFDRGLQEFVSFKISHFYNLSPPQQYLTLLLIGQRLGQREQWYIIVQINP